MKKPWFKSNPGLFEQVKKEIQENYPNLHGFVENETLFVRGSFPITFENQVIDRYLLEIEFPFDYPDMLPIVRETEGRIPRTLDSHIITEDGQCCLFLPDDRWKVYPKGSSFLDFLTGPVHTFFLGQTTVRSGQPWPFGEHEHGIKGILDYYEELLGTNDPQIILTYLRYLSKPVVKGHWPCPCGSGIRLRNCHFKELIELREKIPLRTATHSLMKIYLSLKQFREKQKQ